MMVEVDDTILCIRAGEPTSSITSLWQHFGWNIGDETTTTHGWRRLCASIQQLFVLAQFRHTAEFSNWA